MSTFSKIEAPYFSKQGCRLIWSGIDEDDSDTVLLNKDEFENLVEILTNNNVGKVELEDNYSEILINSDVTQFRLKDKDELDVSTPELRKHVLEYAKIPHNLSKIKVASKEFYPSVWTQKTRDSRELDTLPEKNQTLLHAILSGTKTESDVSPTDYFRIISTRRSTRKFAKTKVEDWKIEKILAAADTAPTAGNFQGFEIFYIKNNDAKQALVEAANNQPYVNAPLVLVFCMDPSRVKLKFPTQILAKFSLQDATLAAAYSQLAASALGLSSIWIGMIDEEKIKKILDTTLTPSSILCIGYPATKRPPKSRRKLKDLINVIE